MKRQISSLCNNRGAILGCGMMSGVIVVGMVYEPWSGREIVEKVEVVDKESAPLLEKEKVAEGMDRLPGLVGRGFSRAAESRALRYRTSIYMA